MQPGSVASQSPSFNRYSNTRFAEIAVRVVEEFSDEFHFEREGNSAGKEEEEDEFEFEFASVTRDLDPPAVTSADEIFLDGRIRPVYTVFNRNLLDGAGDSGPDNSPRVRLSLRKLFIEERETAITAGKNTTSSSCSSSEADELDGVPADMYCVWRPKAAAEGMKVKSKSASFSSKRWRLRLKDLLQRSNSDRSRGGLRLGFVSIDLTISNSGIRK